jgi:L-lactate dehydrogenase complex protein LldG
MSGPSATADIEGVLIHGVQGIRSLTVILLSDECVRLPRC